MSAVLTQLSWTAHLKIMSAYRTMDERAGREISSGVYEILGDLVSEAVKKAIRGRHACRILFLFGLL